MFWSWGLLMKTNQGFCLSVLYLNMHEDLKNSWKRRLTTVCFDVKILKSLIISSFQKVPGTHIIEK